MRDIDPDSEENQQQSRDNERYIGGLQLEAAMQHHKDIDVMRAMSIHGGSFVQALALACLRADADNLARIKGAFPEIWSRYEETGEQP